METTRTTLNQTAKARRALDAITTIVNNAITPSEEFYPNDLATGLQYVRHNLFHQPDAALAAAWWHAIAVQDQITNRLPTQPTYTTTRPLIEIMLDIKIDTLAISEADLFDGLD